MANPRDKTPEQTEIGQLRRKVGQLERALGRKGGLHASYLRTITAASKHGARSGQATGGAHLASRRRRTTW